MTMESILAENYDESPEEMRVLVVDSDPACLELVSKLIGLCGYQVLTAKYADEALSIAQKRKNDLHLVLMEVHLPDMNKYELLEKMAEVSNLPIVIMSYDENEKAMLGGLFKGAMLYLVKPITVTDIRNLWQFPFMKRVAGRRTATEQFPSWSKYRKVKRDREWAGEITESAVIRRPKLIWTDELHNKFLEAVNDLGIERAHPKEILRHMNVPGIRKDNISSHLQKYRLFLKRNPAGSKVFTDSSKSSLISSSRPPSTLNLQETSAQSSNQPEMNSAESYTSIPALPSETFPHPHINPLPQTLPSSYVFLDYEKAAEFAEIGGLNGGKSDCDRSIFDMENYSIQQLSEEEEFSQLPPLPSLSEEMLPALPLYRPLMEGEGDKIEKMISPPPLAMSPYQNEEGSIFEIGSKQIDDLCDVFGIAKGSVLSFHDEDFDELW